MTQVHFESVSLEDMVRRSDLIVVVQKLDPFAVLDSVSILPKGSEFEGRNEPPYYEPPYVGASSEPLLDKNYPPFVWQSYRFRVVEVLFEAGGAVKGGDTLLVAEAHAGRQLSLHRNYYLRGFRKSPICDRYETKLGPLGDEEGPQELILFVDRAQDGYELAMFGAYEATDQKQQTMHLLEARAPLGTD
jgi:hypothetical protein